MIKAMMSGCVALLLACSVSGAGSPSVANAQANCYTLTIQQNPYAGIIASPAPNCGGSQYVAGTTVTLTARYISCVRFDNWTGDASGNSNPTSIVMDRAKQVGVYVTRITPWC